LRGLRGLTALTVFIATTMPALGQATFSIPVPMLAAPPSLNGVIDDTWSKAAEVTARYDFTYQKDGEPTQIHVAQDADGLDVAFAATQHEPITENAETNGAGVLGDDNAEVLLWPQGANGFSYAFAANARGARYQSSSENSAYAPGWTAVGRRTPSGYVVTMHIPFRVIRSGGSTSWKVQFERIIQVTNSTQAWEYVPGQRSAADPAYAGTLNDIAVEGKITKARPAARLQLYGLGEATTRGNGGNTSRMGADLALPVTATSSLLASVHPDYSNVEIDQQTISPSAFARYYSEVRPFFTQLSPNFNSQFSCTNCPTLLYTPAIPTFREGYAYEGTQGPLKFAAFDAVGYGGRTDDSEVLTFGTQDASKNESVSVQRDVVNLPGFRDETTALFAGYSWQKIHDYVYVNVATERGTNVTQPGQAQYVEYGVGYADKNAQYGLTYQKIGAQFSPADGFVSQPDVAGLQLFSRNSIYFGAKKALRDIQISNFVNEQNDHNGRAAFKSYNGQVNFDFRHELTLHVFGGYGKNETFDGQYLPFNQNGIYLGYQTQTATPIAVTHAGGSYYHGSLNSWSYLATRALSRKLKLSLEADESSYAPGGTFTGVEPATRQWLERASLDWQFSRYAQFDVGARRIVGGNLPNAFQAPDLPTAGARCGALNGFSPFDCTNAGNVSAAFHFLAGHNEWYVVYGNPNNLSTLPAFYVKWIRYIGAEKGT
jgi:hypothetical protein